MSYPTVPPPPPSPFERESLASVDLRGVKPVNQACLAVMLAYIQDPDMSLERAWELTRVDTAPGKPWARDVVSMATISNRSSLEGWVAKKTEHWATVRTQILRQMRDATVNRRHEVLTTSEEALDRVFSQLLGREIDGKKAKPLKLKTAEGAVTALTRLVESIERQRERLAGILSGGVAPGAGEEGSTTDDGIFSEDVLDALGDLIAQRALVGAAEEDEDGKEED